MGGDTGGKSQIRLTDSQKQLAADNADLIYGYLTSKHLDYSEWYGTAAVGFCIAVAGYDQSKGKLSTFVYKCMHNAVLKEIRAQTAVKRSAPEMASLDFMVSDGVTLGEITPDKSDPYGIVETLSDIETQRHRLGFFEQDCLKMLMDGYAQKDIVKRYGYSRQHVSKTIQNMVQKLNLRSD